MNGTGKHFWHGADVTITRAHIEEEQQRRAKAGLAPLTPDAMTVELVHFPEPRHYHRAHMLMLPRAEPQAAEVAS